MDRRAPPRGFLFKVPGSRSAEEMPPDLSLFFSTLFQKKCSRVVRLYVVKNDGNLSYLASAAAFRNHGRSRLFK